MIESKRKLLLYLGIFLVLVNFLCSYSELIVINELISFIMLFIGSILLLISSFLKEHENIFIKLFLVFIAVLIYIISKQSGMFQMIIIMISLKNEKIDDIIKFIFKITSIFLFIHIISYIIIYIYDKNILSFNFRYGENILRHKFLFKHANFLGALVSWNCLALLYLKRENIKIIDYIYITIMIGFIILFPNSRTSSLILLIVLICFIIRNKIPILLKKIIKNSIFILGILSLLLLFTYNKFDIIKSIDNLLNARIRLGYVAYEKYGLMPFGQNIIYGEKIDVERNYGISSIIIDSSYYKMFFSYGYVTYLVFLIYVFKKPQKINLEDKKIYFLLAYALFSFTESTAIFPLFAFPILLLVNE